MNLFYSKMDPEPVTERTPIFRNIHISNLTGSEVNTAINIFGLEEMPVYDITLDNINIESKHGVLIDKAKNLVMRDVRIDNEMGVPFKIANSENIMINNIWTGKPISDKPLIGANDINGMFIQGCFPLMGGKSFIKLDGENKDVVLKGNYLNRLPQVVDSQSKSKSIIIE